MIAATDTAVLVVDIVQNGVIALLFLLIVVLFQRTGRR